LPHLNQIHIRVIHFWDRA